MIGIYVRVSTEEQAHKGYSLREQIHACEKIIHGEPCRKYIDEGVSGEILDRPALNQLREDARAGRITKIVCLDPDRLSRKLLNQLLITDELEKYGVEIQFVNSNYEKTPEGQLFYSLRGAIAEFEKAKIKERTSRGRRQKAREGKILRDFQIYGYDYDPERQMFVVNEREAQIVREIFTLFTEPSELGLKGINGIANYLTSRGIPTKRKAGVWHRQVVRQILMNRAYIGEFYANRWDTDGAGVNKFLPPEHRKKIRERPREEWIRIEIPAIIPQEQFARAQALLSKSRRLWAGRSKQKYLLSGLVRCECGNTMTGIYANHWGKKVRMYTCRKNYSGAKNKGCGRKIHADPFEKEIWHHVKVWLFDPQIIAREMTILAGRGIYEEEIERLKREIGKVRNGRKEYMRLFIETGADVEEIKDLLLSLRAKEKQLTLALRQMEEKAGVGKNHSLQENQLQEIIQAYMQEDFDLLPFEEKQMLIRRMIEQVLITENGAEIYTV